MFLISTRTSRYTIYTIYFVDSGIKVTSKEWLDTGLDILRLIYIKCHCITVIDVEKPRVKS